MSENKKTFDVTLEGKETKMAVLRPKPKDNTKAQQVYSKAFRDAIDSGAIVRARIDAVMRDQKLWDETRQNEYEKVTKRILESERRLAAGGIKLSEARELALQMRRDRWELRNLSYERNQLDLHTAEAQAENARFNYLVSACTVYADTGKPYFKDYDDYLGRDSDPVALPAANALGRMIYGLDDKFEHNLAENKFLAKYKFCDDSLHLIDKRGRRIDAEGRLVDEQGRYINERGEFIDIDGNLLTAEGDYKVDFQPFLDDEDNPIDEEGHLIIDDVPEYDEATSGVD